VELMINLNDLFHGGPTVTLLEPRGDTPYFLRTIRLLLNDGGLMRELTITADLMTSRETYEDEGCLALSVVDVEAPPFSHDTGEWVDDGQSMVTHWIEPKPEWCVTPGGEHVDLRGDGLFG
jgi:hypothetical protein